MQLFSFQPRSNTAPSVPEASTPIAGTVTLTFSYTVLDFTCTAEIGSWAVPVGMRDGDTVQAFVDISAGAQTVATPAHSGALVLNGAFDMSEAKKYLITITRKGSTYIWAVASAE